MTTRFPKITDEALAELAKDIGVERPVADQFNKFASVDTIRHFARGIGDTNPLFNDEDYAKDSRWECIVAPPTFLYSTFGRGARQGLPGVHAMWAGSEFECSLPIRAGDRIRCSVFMSALTPKTSRYSGRSVYQEWTHACRNQDDGLIAEVKHWVIRTQRDTAKEKGKYSYLQPAHYTEKQIEAIESDYDKEEIRGATPRYWEDIQEGDELPHVVKGPLTVTDNIAWKIGWGFHPFALAHRIGLEYRRKHPGVRILNDQGIPDVPERVHWENEFARRVGVPAAFDTGPQRGSWLCQVVTNWMGDDGFIKKYRNEARRFVLVGDTAWCKGKVVRKYTESGEYLVDLDLWVVDQRGELTMPGSAVVALPSRTQGLR